MSTYVTLSNTQSFHQVISWRYVRSIVRAAMRGEKIPPIFVHGGPNGGALLAGTHRAAANGLMEALGHYDCMVDHVSYDESIASDAMREAVDSNSYDDIDHLWGDRDLGHGIK